MVIFGVLDTETTGLGKFDRHSPRHDDYAISLGLVVADADVDTMRLTCLDSLYSLIRIPDPARSNDTFFIHGISEDSVANAPAPEAVCSSVLELEKRYGFDVAAAWNHQFDRYFVDRLFRLSDLEKPQWDWLELQPAPFAKLDSHVKTVSHDEIRQLPAHNALNDSVRALGVFAHRKGFDLDLTPIRQKLL